MKSICAMDTGDDKMLKGAKREHKTVMEIAEFYTKAFFEDCAKLNIKTPDVVAPATSMIDEFIRVIGVLMDKGYAYEAGGNIYFDTSKLEQYYVFGDFSEDDLEVGVREGVEEDTNKRNKADFVLWFTKSKFDDQELKWDSPWGVGYPGWHIECSCISMKNLGEYLDLVIDILERLRPDLYIERVAGEVPPRFVNETPWGLIRNDGILRLLDRRLEERDTFQGKLFNR